MQQISSKATKHEAQLCQGLYTLKNYGSLTFFLVLTCARAFSPSWHISNHATPPYCQNTQFTRNIINKLNIFSWFKIIDTGSGYITGRKLQQASKLLESDLGWTFNKAINPLIIYYRPLIAENIDFVSLCIALAYVGLNDRSFVWIFIAISTFFLQRKMKNPQSIWRGLLFDKSIIWYASGPS